MLTDIQDTRIASIAEENELDEDQLEGAARFFISRTNTDLSPELKQKLLKHALESTDENKIFQAKRVFQD